MYPYILSPGEDESFSSWLIRSSQKIKLNVNSFLDLLEIKSKFNTNWDLYIDPSISSRIKSHFSDEFQLPKSMAEKTFHNFQNLAFVTHYTEQYCPKCLKKKGYYKLSWRLIIFFGCTDCKILLLDKCEKCNRLISNKRSNHFYLPRSNFYSYHYCYYCEFDLRKSKTTRMTDKQIELLCEIDKVYQALPESILLYEAYLFFDEFLSKKFNLNMFIKDYLGINKKNFNNLSNHERYIILSQVSKLVNIFPKSVHKINFELNIIGNDWFSSDYLKTTWTEKYKWLF